jgi:hypothetical protein
MPAIVLLVAAQFASGVQPVERISPKTAAERVSRCGLGPVTIKYEELLQSDVLTAREAVSASDEQLACADGAASYYDLELPAAVQPRYDAIRSKRAARFATSQARQWLAARDLLERVPKYEKGLTDDAAFTRDIEKLCGPRASGAFQSSYGPHVLSPDWIKRELRPGDFDSEAMACLMSAAHATEYEIGIIGNEASPGEPAEDDR